MQGFLFAKPATAEAIDQMLAAGSPLSPATTKAG
jgi:EAL domain-containing protein (putative c-di-GMP-specific phosphodiesterase class I)